MEYENVTQDDKDTWRKKKRKRNRTIDYSDLPSTLVYECSVSDVVFVVVGVVVIVLFNVGTTVQFNQNEES